MDMVKKLKNEKKISEKKKEKEKKGEKSKALKNTDPSTRKPIPRR